MSGLDLSGLLIFAGVFAVAAASPGPTIAAIVARVLARGTPGIAPFIAGLVLGDLTWLTFAVLGLAIVAQTFQALFLVIKYAGAAYLLYLGWKLWRAPVGEPQAPAAAERREGPKLFLGGLALALGNPKTMMFYLALLPNVVDLPSLTPLAFAEIAASIVLILTAVLGGYVFAAGRARRLLSSGPAMRLVNRGTGVVLAGAAVAVATR